MEGQEPGLRAQLRLTLEPQKPRETGDKSSGRTVVPTTQTTKEDIHMEATQTHQHSSETRTSDSHPSVDAVEKNTARMANAAEAMVARFDKQNSFKAQAIRMGATAVATGLVTGLVVVGVQALLEPAAPEMTPAVPKK